MSGNQQNEISRPLNTVEEAIEDIKNGKIIIVVDDYDRENEGDFVVAAEKITTEIVNFMAKHGRGLICASIPESRCKELNLELKKKKNTALHETPFTVSVDLIGQGCTTGISAADRAKTIFALVDDNTKAEDLGRPGHIFPLMARENGVLRRAGHTEAVVDLTKLAGLKPGGALVEIMNDDGTMARLPQLMEIADKFDLKIISIEYLINYQLDKGDLVNEIESRKVKTAFGEFDFHAFQEKHTDQIHFALTKGNWEIDEPVLVRVQSSSAYFDVLSRLINGENPQLEKVTNMINAEGKGAIIFINNVSNAELTMRKLQQFLNYQDGQVARPTLTANFIEYGIGTQILKKLGITKFRVITQNPNQKPLVAGYGVEITEMVQM